MNSLDTIYFNAISEASEGRLDIRALNPLLNAATKFQVLGEPQEAARHYERLFQLYRSLETAGTVCDITPKQKQFFKNVMSEYATILKLLERTSRLSDVEKIIQVL